MYVDIDVIKNIAALITALGVIGAAVLGFCKWYLKQNQLKEEIENLRAEHVKDIQMMEEEACMHTYGILACLKGLHEKGCNGPVTDAIEKFEKYINKRAHDQNE